MKLIKIALCNFRQFFGQNEIEFSSDIDKNITLIHGENGLGKTTLLNGVLWCLYGNFTSDFENKDELINLHSLKIGNTDTYVELYFFHENKEYYIKREHKLGQLDKVTSFELTDGVFTKEIKNAGMFIESVIPPQMSDYFFFHGEGIASISEDKNITKFRKAIRDILGFTSVEHTIDDLKSIITLRKNEIQKLTKKNSVYNRAYTDKINNENLKSECMNRKSAISFELQDLERELDNQNALLSKIERHNVSEIQSRKTIAERNRKNFEEQLILSLSKKKNLVKNYATKLFGYNLAEKASIKIEEKEILGEIPSPYDESLINKIISGKLCLCGRPVNEHSEEFKKISLLKNSANTTEIKKRRLDAIAYAGILGKISSIPEEFIHNFSFIDNDINQQYQQIESIKYEITDLENKLDAIGDGGEKEVYNITNNIRKIQNQKVSKQRDLHELERNISNYNAKIIESDRVVNSNKIDNNIVYGINQEIIKIEKLIKRCESKLNSYEATAKTNIASSVNLLLSKFSRKDFTIKVTNNFEFKLSRNDGSLVAKSKGENLLLNLSFIAALLGFCAMRSSSNNKFLIKGTVAPFFIDAPFGELDETYRHATASFLPGCCQQLVLLLSSSHWKGTVNDSISSKVGKEYLLISHKMESQNGKPEDYLTIRNKDYKQSIYDSSFEGSVIEAI